MYAYTQGLASARAIEQQVSYEPGLRWLCADEAINHHTLSDFRTSQKEQLEALFVQVLGVIEQKGLVDLKTVMQDGTKVRAQSSRESFHRRKTLEEHCEQARALVEELKQREASGDQELSKRQLGARQRAGRERVERREAALEQLRKREAAGGQKPSEQLRVSESEPDARKMKQPNGGWEASYNVQVLTDVKAKIVLGVAVTQAANDTQQLVAGLKLAEHNTGHKPERMVADGGYSSRENVAALAGQEVEFIAPWKDGKSRTAGQCRQQGIAEAYSPAVFRRDEESQRLWCPAGRPLELKKTYKHHGLNCQLYQAALADCLGCVQQPQCCPHRDKGGRRVERVEEAAVMRSHLERMQTAEAQGWYKQRSEVAEFPHLWWKGVWKWRQFSVRELLKAAQKALWVALAYNIQQWIRLRWTPRVAAG